MPRKNRDSDVAGNVVGDGGESIQNSDTRKRKFQLTSMKERISFLRKEIGYQKIVQFTGVSASGLSQYCNGVNAPGGEFLEKLAACAKAHDERFSAAWLLTGEGQPFPPQRPESAEGQAALAAIAGRAVSMTVDGMRQLQAALPLLDAMPDLAAFDQAREDLDAALRDRTDKTRKVEVSEPPDMTTRKNSGQRKGPPAGDAAPEKGT